MARIIERLRLQQQIKNLTAPFSVGGSSDPKLEKELEETKKQLNIGENKNSKTFYLS
jgi:hypothetical protein